MFEQFDYNFKSVEDTIQQKFQRIMRPSRTKLKDLEDFLQINEQLQKKILFNE